MYAGVKTGVLFGLDTEISVVETDLSPGLPCFCIVGLADQSVREAKERIRSALINEGFPFPTRRITVNLAPAGRKKEGTHFDLPIAVSVLTASGRIKQGAVQGYGLIGELSLDGTINGVSGVLPLLIGMQQKGIHNIVLPEASLDEAMLLTGLNLFPVKRLKQLVAHLTGEAVQNPIKAAGRTISGKRPWTLDFRDVRGQETMKRIITIAGAARHGLLLVGPPGIGKTMLCQRIPGILPEMSYEEQLEVTKIYSAAGLLNAEMPIVSQRPFRTPHHSLSAAAFFGGGTVPRPGEISLAHRGVLFLDELPEFSPRILELLRTPMETRYVTISRLHGSCLFPADFMLVAAMNPCKCGYLGDPLHSCTCSESQLRAYWNRLSGPLLDRIDLHAEMAPISCESLNWAQENPVETGSGLSSKDMRLQIAAAGELQKARYRKDGILYNSELTPILMKKYCTLSKDCEALLQKAFQIYGFSVRVRDKLVRISRTIADLSECEEIRAEHVAEAVQYRGIDRIYRDRR